MKLNFAIIALILFSLSTTVTSCKKSTCGYCQTTCPGVGGTGGTGNIVSNGATVCQGDGGVQAALSNAQQACAQVNGVGGCTSTWISK